MWPSSSHSRRLSSPSTAQAPSQIALGGEATVAGICDAAWGAAPAANRTNAV